MIINGLKINYRTIGEGRPLLILHGWGSQSAKWQKVGELLAEKGIKAIIPDLPGFGQSQNPPEAWNLNDYCSFLEEFVKTLGIDKFYLLGHSFGGALAVKCSLKFPEKIDKLFLVGAACVRRKSFKKKLLFVVSKIFKIFSFFPLIKKAFYRFIVRSSDCPYAQGVMKDICLKVIKQDLSDILEKIEIPTIIIWGGKDNVLPLKQGYLINQKIQNSKLIIIPEGNHDLEQKIPEILTEKILENL